MGRHRAAADVRRLAAAGPDLAAGSLCRRCSARSRCWRSCWSPASGRGQRQPELARLRRARSASSRPRRPSWRSPVGAPTCWPASASCSTCGSTCSCRSCPVGVRHPGLVLLGGDLGTAIILVASCSRCSSSPGRRCGCSSCSAVWPRVVTYLSVIGRPHRSSRITVWLHPSQADPLNGGLQALHGKYALASGGWWGARPRRRPGEVGRPARGAHRLHLRGHRRGARAGRHARRARPLRRCSAYAGLRVALRSTDDVRPARGRRDHRLDHRAGAGQHRRGARPAAHRRRAAAAGLLRRLGAAVDDVRARHADVLRAAEPGAPEALAARRAHRRDRWRRAGAVRAGSESWRRCSTSSLAGGGTAGHIEPALAFADALRRRDPTSGSPRWAPSAASRPGSSRRAATTSR